MEEVVSLRKCVFLIHLKLGKYNKTAVLPNNIHSIIKLKEIRIYKNKIFCCALINICKTVFREKTKAFYK